jgi:CRP-like cAMP-binding protein
MIPLVLVGPDIEYLERIRSPLAEVLRGWPADLSKLDHLKALIPDAPPVRSALLPVDRLATELLALLASHDDGRVGFFHDIDEAEFRRLLERGHVIECTEGDFIIRRGQIVRTVFVVLKGELEAQRGGVGINAVHPGECFGEIAFLLGLPRTVDVVAKAPRVLLLSLNEGVVRSLIAKDPDIAAKLMLNMARGLALKLARRDAAKADTEAAAV